MATLATNIPSPLSLPDLRPMFEARKRVFVDLLKWDVPVLQGRYELDQFDDEHAVYLIVSGPDGRHAGSARLLRTDRPHILDSLFPDLCAETPPHGPDVMEITRFCLEPRGGAHERLEIRNLLVSAIVRYAFDAGIRTYTGVAEMGWLQQILAFGWHCRPLGLPRRVDRAMLGALAIEISGETPSLLEANGIYRTAPLVQAGLREAA